ncbi:acetyl-CoA carboxylase, carboxyltransferase subunit beta [Lachnotalea glycerini]|uniref:Acetyl-coenzyme A carboxylase carboxyl transferase subunit beta n=1 Tax=Lachnotalea glycerini TaxID=1763509 RepID=A0A371JJH8_9FIRM|nr:acetyl-CoA carboxylase, carboxyltransferase subunit beta [Lachnotalea glycerini]RDY32893.1 acetyl-CoA carboxylase carboxyltransferase subunit beta [Lachnotalea glycerini]
MAQNLFVKCKECGTIIERKKYAENNDVCNVCDSYGTLDYKKRLAMVIDHDTFEETNIHTGFYNPIDFPGYLEKHEKIKSKTGLTEAIVTGKACINEQKVMIGIMDTRYMMGSMGIIVGEKVTRLFEDAKKLKYPVIIFTASGGARMQEGIFSLMQMAKTAAAVSSFGESGGLYISVLTNPTTGGVSASFAFLGDIIVAEPGALIGFAGKRVIEQTINEVLPPNFQTSEYLFEHGYIDMIVERKTLKDTLGQILKIHSQEENQIFQ